jgi:hypothetical protein
MLHLHMCRNIQRIPATCLLHGGDLLGTHRRITLKTHGYIALLLLGLLL